MQEGRHDGQAFRKWPHHTPEPQDVLLQPETHAEVVTWTREMAKEIQHRKQKTAQGTNFIHGNQPRKYSGDCTGNLFRTRKPTQETNFIEREKNTQKINFKLKLI